MSAQPGNLVEVQTSRQPLSSLVSEVDRLVERFVPVSKACELIGLSRASYYRLKAKTPVSDNDGGSTNSEAGQNQQIQADSSTCLPDQSNGGK